jgi:glycosyltransferase involved in cell wall biosynthesis
MSPYSLQILGCYGIPARHGGFEAFAEMFAQYLVQKGWHVRVYCQLSSTERIRVTEWNGVELYHVPAWGSGVASTVHYDVRCMRIALKTKMPILTLGYNTAFLNYLPRLHNIPNVINMGGIEWKRGKWGAFAKSFFYINERLGSRFGDYLVADHPEIKKYLERKDIQTPVRMIPYSAKKYNEYTEEHLKEFSLVPQKYLTVIAHWVEENQILEIVQAFSRRKRGVRLVVLGRYNNDYPYHTKVLQAASAEVDFIGSVYQPEVASLRVYSLGYVHGHTVGGTNPSLVEALHAENPVIAAENPFNRWVAGPSAKYFSSVEDLDEIFTHVLSAPAITEEMSEGSRMQYEKEFSYEKVMGAYHDLMIEVIENKRAIRR